MWYISFFYGMIQLICAESAVRHQLTNCNVFNCGDYFHLGKSIMIQDFSLYVSLSTVTLICGWTQSWNCKSTTRYPVGPMVLWMHCLHIRVDVANVAEMIVRSISFSSSSSSSSSSVTASCSVLAWMAGELCEYVYWLVFVLSAFPACCCVFTCIPEII